MATRTCSGRLLLLYWLVSRARGLSPGEVATVALLVGSQVPDLVDKPLAWYLGVLPTGRTLAHSVVVIGPLVAVVYLVSARYSRRAYGIAFGVGAVSHILVDAVPVLWGGTDPSFLLWPILPVEPYASGAPSVIALFVDSLDDPYFLAEFVFAAIALAVWRQDGYPGVRIVRRLGQRWLPARG